MMIQRTRNARLLGAALTAVLSAGLAGFSGLVFCVGADGHRALEFEHAWIGCQTENALSAGIGSSLQGRAPADCLDLPAASGEPVVPGPSDANRLPEPELTILAALPEAPPRIEARLTSVTDARAGPSPLAPHIASTVLLV